MRKHYILALNCATRGDFKDFIAFVIEYSMKGKDPAEHFRAAGYI